MESLWSRVKCLEVPGQHRFLRVSCLFAVRRFNSAEGCAMYRSWWENIVWL